MKDDYLSHVRMTYSVTERLMLAHAEKFQGIRFAFVTKDILNTKEDALKVVLTFHVFSTINIYTIFFMYLCRLNNGYILSK